ncbi:hypothetical protein ACFQT4_23715 [Pseudoduganella danionis]|uniref:hypothetical protein n=1 Tax=Pseudoduganella danionis TaxID=1890295 RepID=UPI0036128141
MSRDLSAAQKGQLLQIRRGQAAPQLLQESSLTPDVIAPPRVDEPSGKPVANNNSAAPISLDPQKNASFQQAVNNAAASGTGQNGGKNQETTPPPAVVTPGSGDAAGGGGTPSGGGAGGNAAASRSDATRGGAGCARKQDCVGALAASY